MYLDEIKSFPKTDTRLKTEKGNAYHIKTDVFKRQMWYAYEGDNSGLVALSPERVREVAKMNADGKKPFELIEFKEAVEVKAPDYSNVVGQDSLNRFEHAFKAKKKKKKPLNKRPNDVVSTVDAAKAPQARPVLVKSPDAVANQEGGASVEKRKNKRPFKKKRPNSPSNPGQNENNA
jgi:hypothetical protein